MPTCCRQVSAITSPMTFHLPAMALLHGGCALLYAALAALILRAPAARSRTGLWLAGACLVTAALGRRRSPVWHRCPSRDCPPGWNWRAPPPGTASSCTFTAAPSPARRQLTQTFVTMGLLALLLVGGLPLIDAAGLSARRHALWSAGAAIRLGFAVGNILLLENLYFNTPAETRWHINLLCVALGGLFRLRPAALRRRPAVPPRLAPRCSRRARRSPPSPRR